MCIRDRIEELEKEKKKAGKEEQLSYQIEIQSAQTNLKTKEYEQKSKETEIEGFKKTIDHAQVNSELAGVVKSITTEADAQQNMYMGDQTQSLISIVGTGAFRIKCRVNEQNLSLIHIFRLRYLLLLQA